MTEIECDKKYYLVKSKYLNREYLYKNNEKKIMTIEGKINVKKIIIDENKIIDKNQTIDENIKNGFMRTMKIYIDNNGENIKFIEKIKQIKNNINNDIGNNIQYNCIEYCCIDNCYIITIVCKVPAKINLQNDTPTKISFTDIKLFNNYNVMIKFTPYIKNTNISNIQNKYIELKYLSMTILYNKNIYDMFGLSIPIKLYKQNTVISMKNIGKPQNKKQLLKIL